MTRQEIIAELNQMGTGRTDAEADHGRADDLLCDALRLAGWDDVADAFNAAAERVGFWYA